MQNRQSVRYSTQNTAAVVPVTDDARDTSPEWDRAGLPDECPECGESELLYAVVDEWDGETATRGTFACDRPGCGHQESFGESDTERGT